MRYARVVVVGWLSSLTVVTTTFLAVGTADEPTDPPILATSDFPSGRLDGWEFTDPEAWRLTEVDGRRVLELHRNSDYQPPVRSPLNIGLMPDSDAADFVLDVRLRSTTPDYGHRDLCIFFGYQDPSHFYYVHLGKEADPHSNNIFLVNGEPRVAIAETTTEGTPWTDDWHHVRIVRQVDPGQIQVFFDDLETPVMTAHDTTFRHGRVGVGSFDDTGQFDAMILRGQRASASSHAP